MFLAKSGANSFCGKAWPGRARWLLCILWDGAWMGPLSVRVLKTGEGSNPPVGGPHLK